MALTEYRRKRHFGRTAEPKGRASKTKGSTFVVQKHDASHLHYDFRLQIDGVLKSWAVPKGPSLNPAVKRLAMHVEDHPLEYGSFEGTIPAGEYGAGTVMVWDQGTWEPEGNPSEGYREGKLHFVLHGDKLRGEWVLVRSGGQPARQNGKESWLLFKVRDDEARGPDEPDILEERPESGLTGRDLAEIASGTKVWRSKRKKAAASKSSSQTTARKTTVDRQQTRQTAKQKVALLPQAKASALPAKIVPQLATLAKEAPAGDQWLNEIKYDGYRMICRVDHKDVTFASRNQLDWTSRLEHLAKAVRGLGVAQAIFDGEVVALESNGRSSFQALQNAFREGRSQDLVYYVFDLLYLDGKNLTKVPLEERKQLLAGLLGKGQGPLRYSEHVEGNADEFFRQACKLKLEGIICKQRDRPYRPGRSTEWLKVKCSHREEFVIGGYTPPAGSRQGFGALLVGYYNDQHELIYAGRVGTGFSDRLLVDLAKQLKSLEQKESPFKNLSGRTGAARGVQWMKPKLVAQVEFSEWTRDGSLRHPSFQGLREDKPAAEVVREKPLALKAMKKSVSKKTTGKKSPSKPQSHGKLPTAEIPDAVRLTHPDKVFYPGAGITKADLAAYYATIADWILPQLKDRPLVLVRCPDGQGKECFYQKHAGPGTPASLRRVPIVEKSRTMQYVMVDDIEGLVSLAQIGVLEIHAWGSRADKIELPDRLVFDLDPDPSVPWSKVAESARQIRQFLADLDLVTFLKTTGGKGLHLVLPVQRRLDWDETKRVCQAISEAIVRADPTRYTANMSKAARHGKIYIDYLRNARGATAVAAYSTRAREGAPVSTPISWEELSLVRSGDHFKLEDITRRLAALKRDPWHDLATTRQSITKQTLKSLGI